MTLPETPHSSYEFRITGSPDGGYHSGALGRTWTDKTAALAALTEYRNRCMADTFMPERYRRAHVAAVHVVGRMVTDWVPIEETP